MGIDLVWRDAAGRTRDAAYDNSDVVAAIIDRLRQDRSMRDLLLVTIDPYGDTRFASGQSSRLLREFELVRQQSSDPEERIALGHVISILRAADGATDEWLDFLGD